MRKFIYPVLIVVFIPSAPFAAILYFLPDFLPFFPPSKGTLADRAYF
jgi:hypothetical protein